MEKYRHKLFRRGVWGHRRPPMFCPGRGSREKAPPESHALYNRKDDVFDHFKSAFNNMKFRLFCPFLTILLPTNYNFNVLVYPDISLADGWMITLLYTLRNFNAKKDNKIHVLLSLLSGLLFIMNYSLFFTCISL